MASLQKEILNRQISALQKEAEPLQAQWETTLDEGQRVKLERQLQQKLKKIQEIENQLQKIENNETSVIHENKYETCPYVGLNAFDESTAQWFFGRETAFKRLMSKIEQSPFVFVVGVSGSGKSSLVKAKLIPEMKRRGHRILLMKPWSNPIQRLKDVFAEILEETGTDVIEFEQRIDTEGLLAAIADLPKPILLVIDQFEEVFTVCSQIAERRKFIQMLVDVAQTQTADFVVVATMRIDFLADCTYANLDAIVNEQMVVISGMSEDELRDAIAKPAETQGYQLSDGLLDAILQDIEAEPNCLPLLEFALQELWENRNRQQRRLSLEGYRQMKRLKGALNRHADHLYEKLSASGQKWIRRIFLKLVRTGNDAKDTRQRERRQAILDLAGDDGNARKEIERILKSLEGKSGRLLVASEENGVAIVDLAHEALMDGWQRFAEWRLEDRDLRRLGDRVKDAFDEWERALDKDKFLLSEGVVAQIEEVEMAINDYLTLEQQKFVQRNRYKYKPWLDPANLPEMVDIPSGTFWMGSPEGKGENDEKPYHQVTVKAFWMGKYPVTQAQWRTVAMTPKVEIDLSLNPSYHRGENKPVEQVNWYEAQEFCARLSKLTGENYRLPSEAEWEYACRAGASEYSEYCFGDDASQLDDYGWYGNNSGDRAIDTDQIWKDVNQNPNRYIERIRQNNCGTHLVGLKPANAWGLYDMHGNVWEWCADDWHDDYEGAPFDSQIWTKGIKNYKESGETKKLLRGGSWYAYAQNCRSACRLNIFARVRSYFLGFRVVCVLR
ncbi:nSTAND1 domain-containing NTPase [Pseudanabaena yagii]|uniref:SUMF1/EgtB/PvdO family nonheme iron enzyme n=1 Tax=Pseudanabaena yagii GIHE-NHR1 TaxID=2722753 RepID=A0ABX1LS77_9CYAN|nr:SUMF1/EgtB/PvdO family nonheme iron enzyme [Pseudanabaena yagii]NMF57669.1 SUMF1/EgtB/PvdO family nonheme iron enzyme [Pseudanabaena yagii GIHE-NHR1]